MTATDILRSHTAPSSNKGVTKKTFLQTSGVMKAWCNIANRDTASCHLSGQHEELRVVLSGTALTIRQSVDTIICVTHTSAHTQES